MTAQRCAVCVRGCAAVLLLALAGVSGRAWPATEGSAVVRCAGDVVPVTVARLAFSGNRVTRRSTFLQELGFRGGQVVCPSAIRFGRQAIQDLGLFKKVALDVVHLGEARVQVTYIVEERWYFLPVPRVDANSDAEYGYGLKLKWNNIGGHNHRLAMDVVRRELRERTTSGETTLDATYLWRRFAGSKSNLFLRGRYNEENANDGDVTFNDRHYSAGVGVSRQLTSNRTGQGWQARAGIGWLYGSKHGADAPPGDGRLWRLSYGTAYRDIRDLVYSERGVKASVGISHQLPGLSDYDQLFVHGRYERRAPVGSRAHQAIHWLMEAGTYHGGPEARRNDRFNLGGDEALRGYEQETAEGDTFWRLSAMWLRPVYWDWLRGLVALEVGDTYRSRFAERETPVLVSLAVGFRVRVTWFVDTEIDFGVGVPLTARRGTHIFAGSAP